MHHKKVLWAWVETFGELLSSHVSPILAASCLNSLRRRLGSLASGGRLCHRWQLADGSIRSTGKLKSYSSCQETLGAIRQSVSGSLNNLQLPTQAPRTSWIIQKGGIAALRFKGLGVRSSSLHSAPRHMMKPLCCKVSHTNRRTGVESNVFWKRKEEKKTQREPDSSTYISLEPTHRVVIAKGSVPCPKHV